jgi:hypothetical protein
MMNSPFCLELLQLMKALCRPAPGDLCTTFCISRISSQMRIWDVDLHQKEPRVLRLSESLTVTKF